jgi:hypothetical protein
MGQVLATSQSTGSKSDWTVALPSRIRRLSILGSLTFLGALTGVLVPKLDSLCFPLIATFIAVLSGFSALWSP